MPKPTWRDDEYVKLLIQDSPFGLGDVIRFDHLKDVWHIWDGFRWAPDMTDQVYHLIHQCAIGWIATGVYDGDDIVAMKSIFDISRKSSVLRSLASHPQIAMRGDEWDPDPTLLAFTNGVLDLKTLEFDTHPSPDLLLSRSTRQPWDPDAQCPMFDQFLLDIMGGDEDLLRYLVGVLGYSLFGLQREQKFWMWVGQGQNGKGTLARVWTSLLGDYADTPSDTLYMKTKFGAARSDSARPDLLRLQGIRFTPMSEPNGGHFNEEMLKAHTGEDPVQARDLYGKASSFVTFSPGHTIVFLTNNPPRTEDVGVSMRRRARVIKFEQDFTGDREVKGLDEILKREGPGILARVAAFARAWWNEGTPELPEPQKVSDWSNEYIDENDPLAGFIEEVCVTGPRERSSAILMWSAYQDWATKRDVEPGSQTGFGFALGRRFKKVKTRTGWIYTGIRAKSAVEQADDE